MNPEQWARWFREKHPDESIENLIEALRSAAKFGFWHKPRYAELVVEQLKLLK